MPATPAFRDPALAALAERLAALEPRARAVVEGLSPERMRQRPPAGGWSVAQVFEHMCLSNDLYLARPIPNAVAVARSRPAPSRPFKPSLMGGFLLAMVRESSRRRLPTTPDLEASGPVRDDVVEAFIAGVRDLDAHMHAADGHDLMVSFASPVAAIVKLRLGDAFAVLIEHSHRHLAQAERARAAVGG